MNNSLTEQIVHHILSNFGALPSPFINWEKTQSLIDKQYLLSEKLLFEGEGGQTLHKNVYGCQITVADMKVIKVLLADCTQDKSLPEFCLLVQLQDSPSYGLYLVFNKLVEDPPDSEPMIAVSLNHKDWMPCNTFLQATFLAGMEQIKDLGHNWSVCTKYQSQYETLQSFINFHTTFNEVFDERQES